MKVSELDQVTASLDGASGGRGVQAGICRALEFGKGLLVLGKREGRGGEGVALLYSLAQLAFCTQFSLKCVPLLKVKSLKTITLGGL